MPKTLTFSPRYFRATLFLLLIEVLIALYAHDRIIRPYIGDLIVVILIYCFVKSFLNTPVWPTAIGVLIFSYTIEVLQYFDLVHLLGLQDSEIARIVIGTSFAWADLLAYTVGIVILLFFERKKA
jgi:Rad3-related DNA helicase